MTVWQQWGRQLPRDDATLLKQQIRVAIVNFLPAVRPVAECIAAHAELIALKAVIVRHADDELTRLWKTACYLVSGRVPNLTLPEDLEEERV